MAQYSTRRFHNISAHSAPVSDGDGTPDSVSDEKPTAAASISLNQMPDLVLVKIFSFLGIRERSSVELTCSRWLELSRISLRRITLINLDVFDYFRNGFLDVEPIRRLVETF